MFEEFADLIRLVNDVQGKFKVQLDRLLEQVRDASANAELVARARALFGVTASAAAPRTAPVSAQREPRVPNGRRRRAKKPAQPPAKRDAMQLALLRGKAKGEQAYVAACKKLSSQIPRGQNPDSTLRGLFNTTQKHWRPHFVARVVSGLSPEKRKLKLAELAILYTRVGKKKVSHEQLEREVRRVEKKRGD